MRHLTFFLIIVTQLFSCNEQPKQENTTLQTDDTTNVKADTLMDRYTIREDSKKNIIVEDNLNQTEINCGYIPDYKILSYPQYLPPNLYVIRQFYPSKPNQWDELWVYTKNNGKQLLKKRTIDFKVNNQQTLIAYNCNNSWNYSVCHIDTLLILDLKNNETRTVKITNDTDTIGNCMITSMQWNTDKEIIWGLLTSGAYGNGYFFFSYNYTTNTLNRFAIPKGCTLEFDINPNTGQLVFSDYPPVFDSRERQKLADAKKETHLYVYDFITKKQTLLKTGIATSFRTKWISNHTISTMITDSGKYEFTTEEILTLKNE